MKAGRLSLQLSFYIWEMSGTGWGLGAASESPGWSVQGFGGQRGAQRWAVRLKLAEQTLGPEP